MLRTTSAINWVCGYIDNIVCEFNIKRTLPDEGFFLKSIGEYSLLSMLYLRKETSILESNVKSIRNAITTIAGVFRYGNPEGVIQNNIKFSQIRTCLRKSGLNIENIDKDISTVISSRPNAKGISLEHAYIHGLVGHPMPTDYWLLAAIRLTQISLEHGCTRIWIYQITHFVFFYTDFGEKRENLGDDETLIAVFSDILSKAFIELVNDKDWDLAIEVALSLLYLGVDSINFKDIKKAVDTEIFKYQSATGYVLSNDTTEISDTRATEEQLYSVFHTTIMAILLSLELSESA